MWSRLTARSLMTRPRIVPGMIDARFDDLTGVMPSFRLVGPVGVIEATRTDEVAGAITAAEGAAARGLWVAGFITYEAAPGLDPVLSVRQGDPSDAFAELPLAWFAMFERREETSLPEPQNDGALTPVDSWLPTTARDRYGGAISAIHDHIAAGDSYQVNHTLRLRSRVAGDERGLYRDLCYAQRGAYAGYLNLGRYRILSASPELFFQIDDGRLTTRPMKGTAPRGRWATEDEEVAARLRGSVKDRAENAMIVDLLRNDLGRVAKPGSVTWDDVFDLERFETVWQLTSTVRADLRSDVSLLDVFAALFPSGSVTGAPKVRTMRIIAELEDAPRGAYCGAVGFLSPPGSGSPAARFNVPIRTVVVDTQTGSAEYGVGGGITWDSRAHSEYDETVAKARVLTARRPRFDLFETLRHDPDTGFLHLDRHLLRLRGSAAYFGFRYDEAAVMDALERASGRFSDRPARVRVAVDRRGQVVTGEVPLIVSQGSIHVALDTTVPVAPGDTTLFHKTTLRRRYQEARERHPDADDVLLMNTNGEVTESTVANVAVKLGGRWWTPPLDSGLLPGVGRQVALEDGWLAERVITAEELRRAEALELVSDVRGRRPAELVSDEAHSPSGSGSRSPGNT
jgi:para-aminobenzoate synthetase/4-amino-4-deoxychorismate lyase